MAVGPGPALTKGIHGKSYINQYDVCHRSPPGRTSAVPRTPRGWHHDAVTTHAPQLSVQVVAHRGASEDAPEHTLAAYRKAIEDGADALECDVRLTADGHLVCVHDRTVARTSNGRGVVSTLELAQLAELDFGSWKRAADAALPPAVAPAAAAAEDDCLAGVDALADVLEGLAC